MRRCRLPNGIGSRWCCCQPKAGRRRRSPAISGTVRRRSGRSSPASRRPGSVGCVGSIRDQPRTSRVGKHHELPERRYPTVDALETAVVAAFKRQEAKQFANLSTHRGRLLRAMTQRPGRRILTATDIQAVGGHAGGDEHHAGLRHRHGDPARCDEGRWSAPTPCMRSCASYPPSVAPRPDSTTATRTTRAGSQASLPWGRVSLRVVGCLCEHSCAHPPRTGRRDEPAGCEATRQKHRAC
jgi:hypothetical protein